jgi:hypothetical protein
MNQDNIIIERDFFSIKYDNKLKYENCKIILKNDKENFIQKNNFYFKEDEFEMRIIFFYKNNHKILYEEFEKFIYHLFLTLKIITKEIFDKSIEKALRILESNKFLFMIDNQRKFLIEYDKNELILHPIYNQYFRSDSELYEFYKIFLKVALSEIEGFTRTKIRIESKKLYIDYYDGIDQFFYLINKTISLKELFEQNFDHEDFMQKIACFIIKNVASKELLNLNLDCSYNHPLNNFRYITLITYKLFMKLTFDGSLIYLNQNDIDQIADAITYSNEFAEMPSIISKAYDNLSKSLPFKTIERILKKQRNVEYLF